MAQLSRVDVVEVERLMERVEELERAGTRVVLANMYAEHDVPPDVSLAIFELAGALGMNGNG